ncbi:MAG: tetratricopeptide repeat protein, partial [bacterium]
PEALSQWSRLLELHPDYAPARDWIGWVYSEMGRYEEAIAALRSRLESPDAEIPFVMANLIRAYALAGKKAEAQSLMRDLVQLSERRYVPPSHVAFSYAAVGEKALAFVWLERALKENDPLVITLKTVPWWDPLRSDPRFAGILGRAGFPED